MKKLNLTFLTVIFFYQISFSQLPVFTHADSLRGNLTALRTCYDINYYKLDVKFDIEKKFISGSNLFKFTSVTDFNKLQFDLFANLNVDSVVFEHHRLPYKRDNNAVFVDFQETILKGNKKEFTVYYSGYPTIAKNAPWDGGVVYSKDSTGKLWVATVCEGIGASVWFPNKDHQYDEVDSMMISVSVPNGLKDISNGRLRKITDLKNGYSRFDWFVANPINNYDVAVNIGNYVHINDDYEGEKGKLSLDYWVPPYDVEKAKAHFSKNVKSMLRAYEHWFGPYPFYEDGYKLIEAPYAAMEHQSGISYGNGFKNGRDGIDLSGTGWGLRSDNCIVHESAHEWFGNSITAKDLADLWIHEAFACYAESLYVESLYGKQAGEDYLHGMRKLVANDTAAVGYYNVNKQGSVDMYAKGANMLDMVRKIINDEVKWRDILRGLNKAFYHRTVSYNDIVDYINHQSGYNFSPVFDQYLHYNTIPVLEFSFAKDKLSYRWIANNKYFGVPVRIRVKNGQYKEITPKTSFQELVLTGVSKTNLEVDLSDYYVGMLLND